MATIFQLSLRTKTDKPHTHKVLSHEGTQVISVSFAAGQSVPAHRHPQKTMVLQVLGGQLELISAQGTYSLSQGQLALFSGDEPHALENRHSGQTDVLVTAIPKSA